MAMNSLLILLSLFLLLSPSCCLYHNQPSDTLTDLVAADKTRLGSTPPSCHNKCNMCHPCMAVQVPSLPSHDRVRPSSEPQDYNRYSNYKPLGWKCRCGGRLYDP